MGTPITVKRLTGAIGAEMRGLDLKHSLDERTFAMIHQAFLDHCMLVFRGQHLEPPAQTAFAQRWGKLFIAPFLKQNELPGHSDVIKQVNLGKAESYTTEVWHSDQSFLPAPPSHSILTAQVLPEAGGDTMFASQYAAYENLSSGMKRMLHELRALHRGAKLAQVTKNEDTSRPQSHPIVRTHTETGRKSLYVNRLYTYCIEGQTEGESRGLLEYLFEQSCRPEFTYRHQWTPGDVVMWDNRCALHYAVHDFGEAPRVMHRTTVVGDIPR
jgi:alpha-ketoglutarate-dependent taurine dioxygenase